ncbi:MAG: CSLREA domain-containing protein [Geminicoccaceae bacterium]
MSRVLFPPTSHYSKSAPAAVSAPLVVTTTEDIIDANDGVLSLREAVNAANLREGLDTITFDSALSGKTVTLLTGASHDPDGQPFVGYLAVTDDLIIDGGSSLEDAVTLSATGEASSAPVFSFEGVQARIEDVNFVEGTTIGSPQVFAQDSVLEVERVSFTAGAQYSGGMYLADSDLKMVDSKSVVSGESGTSIDLVGTNNIEIIRCDLTGRGLYAVTIDGQNYRPDSNPDGFLKIIDSSIQAVARYLSVGIDFSGQVEIQNSTITAVTKNSFDDVDPDDHALLLRAGGSAHLNNVTIIGTNGDDLYFDSNIVEIEEGASLLLENSIIVDDGNEFVTTISGDYTDGGGNVLTDRDGVTVDDVFVTGKLEDNGGPTRTVALLDDPSNPAIGAADPATALDVDQRGLPRDAMPDAGAFEAGATAPPSFDAFPDLSEKRPVASGDINGVDPARFLIGADGDASITFLDEYGAYQSVLGVYLIDADGVIHSPKIVFDHIEHAETTDLDGVSDKSRPGGGPLHEGDTVQLADLYDPAELDGELSFGLFLVADGRTENPVELFEGGTLLFRDGGDPATLDSSVPDLVHVADDGTETRIVGDIIHSSDATPQTPLENSLNPEAKGMVLSGLLDDGGYVVGFEDRVEAADNAAAGTTGSDFNDLLVAIDSPNSKSPLVPMDEAIV